jgi:hypothetical protein
MSLVDKLSKAANEIARKNRNGVGNYMITNPIVGSMLADYYSKQILKNKIEKIYKW